MRRKGAVELLPLDARPTAHVRPNDVPDALGEDLERVLPTVVVADGARKVDSEPRERVGPVGAGSEQACRVFESHVQGGAERALPRPYHLVHFHPFGDHHRDARRKSRVGDLVALALKGVVFEGRHGTPLGPADLQVSRDVYQRVVVGRLDPPEQRAAVAPPGQYFLVAVAVVVADRDVVVEPTHRRILQRREREFGHEKVLDLAGIDFRLHGERVGKLLQRAWEIVYQRRDSLQDAIHLRL